MNTRVEENTNSLASRARLMAKQTSNQDIIDAFKADRNIRQPFLKIEIRGHIGGPSSRPAPRKIGKHNTKRTIVRMLRMRGTRVSDEPRPLIILPRTRIVTTNAPRWRESISGQAMAEARELTSRATDKDVSPDHEHWRVWGRA